MQIKVFIHKLERILKEKYPHIDVEFYCSCRKKIVDFGFENALYFSPDHANFVKDIEHFFLKNKKEFDEFEFIKPYFNHSVKWKFDYVIFRGKTSNSI